MNKEELEVGLKDIRKILLTQKKQMNKVEDKKDWLEYFKTIFECSEYFTFSAAFLNIYNKEYYYALIFFLMTGLNAAIKYKLDEKYNSLTDISNTQVKSKNLDYALEFINSCTQEELNSYLSYKMGD